LGSPFCDKEIHETQDATAGLAVTGYEQMACDRACLADCEPGQPPERGLCRLHAFGYR